VALGGAKIQTDRSLESGRVCCTVETPTMTSSVLDRAVHEVLIQSLGAWRVVGKVRREADGVLLVDVSGKELRVSRAPADLPFRWIVAEGERTRGVTSVSGLLRALRAAVDPGYRPVRLRIAPLPLSLPS
jgi:hypothetical protein